MEYSRRCSMLKRAKLLKTSYSASTHALRPLVVSTGALPTPPPAS